MIPLVLVGNQMGQILVTVVSVWASLDAAVSLLLTSPMSGEEGVKRAGEEGMCISFGWMLTGRCPEGSYSCHMKLLIPSRDQMDVDKQIPRISQVCIAHLHTHGLSMCAARSEKHIHMRWCHEYVFFFFFLFATCRKMSRSKVTHTSQQVFSGDFGAWVNQMDILSSWQHLGIGNVETSTMIVMDTRC